VISPEQRAEQHYQELAPGWASAHVNKNADI